jgi:hypothetical protein
VEATKHNLKHTVPGSYILQSDVGPSESASILLRGPAALLRTLLVPVVGASGGLEPVPRSSVNIPYWDTTANVPQHSGGVLQALVEPAVETAGLVKIGLAAAISGSTTEADIQHAQAEAMQRKQLSTTHPTHEMHACIRAPSSEAWYRISLTRCAVCRGTTKDGFGV